MNTQITPFAFNENLLRTIMDEHGNPWFVAKDVALALDYEWNGSKNIQHIPEEWRGVETVSTPSGTQEMLTLSEQGLYFFLGRSDKPKALPYQKWIAGDVMPTLRRTGSYTMPTASNASFQRRAMLAQLENMPEEGKHLRPHVRSKLLWCAMKAAEMDNTGTEGVVQNFSMFCRLVGEAPHSLEGQVQAFVEECLEVAPGARTKAQNIYTALRSWWRQKGKGGMPSEKMLATALDARFSKKKSNTMLYLDCAIGKDWRLPA